MPNPCGHIFHHRQHGKRVGPRLQVGLHCSEVEQELLAGLETLVVLVVKRGLQRGKRVHSGCGRLRGMLHMPCGSPSCCTPRKSLASATSQDRVSP